MIQLYLPTNTLKKKEDQCPVIIMIINSQSMIFDLLHLLISSSWNSCSWSTLRLMQVLRKLHFSPHKFAIRSFEVLLSYFDLLDMDSEMQKNSISTWFRHLPGAHDAHLMELEWFWGLGNWLCFPIFLNGEKTFILMFWTPLFYLSLFPKLKFFCINC